MSSACGRSSTETTAVYDDSGNYHIYKTALGEKVKPLHINDDQFEQLIKTEKKIVLVDFWATWCRPCRMLAPIIEDLATEYNGKVVVAKLETDKNRKTPRKFNIRGIPTVIIFKDGKKLEQIVGYHPKEYYRKILDKLIKTTEVKTAI